MRKIKKSRELELLEEIKKSIDELKKKRDFADSYPDTTGDYTYIPYWPPIRIDKDYPYGYWWRDTRCDETNNYTGNVFDEDSNIIQYKFS